MPDLKYCYGSIAIRSPDGYIKGYFVVRIWREQMDKPELICSTQTVPNTKLVCSALNTTLGLTDDQSDELLQSWIAVEQEKETE